MHNYGVVETAELIAGGESLTVEFKTDVNDRDLTRAVACLANAQGGVLLLGVGDDGTVVRAKPRHRDHTDADWVAASIQNTTMPPLGVEVTVETVDERDVIRITVP